MKARLTVKFGMLKDILAMVAAIHHNATMKYKAHGWEKEPTDATDCTAWCSLDALIRHTLKLCQFEVYEPQSTLAHAAHIASRMQMFFTIDARGDRSNPFLSAEQMNEGNSFTDEQQTSVRNMNIVSSPSVGKYITPEFFQACMELDPTEIETYKSKYDGLDIYSISRTWLATLYDLLARRNHELTRVEFRQVLLKETISFLLSYVAANSEVLTGVYATFKKN
jgi:hypothetical protein